MGLCYGYNHIVYRLSASLFYGLCAATCTTHISLRPNLTIKSNDHGKEGHFCNCRGIIIHLQLTRRVKPLGQLSLYLMTLIVYVEAGS